MRFSRGRGATVVVACFAALALITSACAEQIAETLAEKALENETGGDVDLDFGSGGLNIQTEDGAMSFDAETGEFVLTDDNGDVVTGNVDVGEDGLTVESSEGTLTFDAESGEFVAEGDSGSVTGSVGDDGISTMTVDDGQGGVTTMRADPALAQDWPNDVLAVYPGASVEGATLQSGSDSEARSLILSTSDDVGTVTDFYQSATKDLEGTRSTSPDGAFFLFTEGTTSMIVTVAAGSDGTDIVMNITTSAG